MSRRRARLANLDLLAVVAVGGGLGSLLRYAVTRILPHAPATLPWATLAVNVGGSLTLGVFMVLITQVWRPGRYLRPLVAVGFLGGLTTFSTLMVQLRALGLAGAWGAALVYAAASLVGGAVAVWAGVSLTRRLTGVRR